MIPRQEVEFTLAMAERGVRSETPPDVMAELCRVYLAWLEAPEGWVGTINHGEFSQTVVHLSALQQIEWPDGKRVKLLGVE